MNRAMYMRNSENITLTVGENYIVGAQKQVYKLIMVTTRGFNLLNQSTNRCMFSQAFYAVHHQGEELLGNIYTFRLPKGIICSVHDE